MTPEDQVTDEEVAGVIARGRRIRRAPDVVRARLMARARAAAATPAPVRTTAAPAPRRWVRVAFAGMLLMFAAAGAAAGVYVAQPDTSVEVVAPVPPQHAHQPARAAMLPLAPEERAPATPHRRRAPISPQESYAAELKLLQHAQSDYAAQEFRGALALVAEHARRFPGGRLAEEREALRVRALVGAGRAGEARRALAAFARRFPHSVLLPRLQEAAARTPDR